MKKTESFTAATPKRFHIPGHYFKFDSVPGGLVSARFFYRGQELYEELTDVVAGWSAKPGRLQGVPGFDEVEITSSATQAVSFYINRGEVDSDTFSGVVQVSNASPGTNYLDTVRYGASFISTTPLAAATSQQVIAPGTNVNGVTLWRAVAYSNNGAGFASIVLQGHTAAPNSVTVGDLLAATDAFGAEGASYSMVLRVDRPIFVAAGKGIYFTAGGAESVGVRQALYTVH